MNTYYFYEFSDLTREPLVFSKEEFEKFCADYKIYMYLSCYTFGFTKGYSSIENEIICTCIPGTNVVISTTFNKTCTVPMAGQLKYALDSFLNGHGRMDDSVEFIKDITSAKTCQSYILDVSVDSTRFLVVVNGKNYKVITENEYDEYDKSGWIFEGNKFLFKIKQIRLMRETETNFIGLFDQLKFNI